jgi:hypothetical protein
MFTQQAAVVANQWKRYHWRVRAIFNAIFPDEIKMPVQNIQALIDSYQERQKTGAIRLGYASEKQLCFLFKRGDMINAYLVTPDKWEALLPGHGMDWMLSAGDAYTKSISLSPFSLLMTKLLIQARSEKTEILESQKQLAEYLNATSIKSETTLLHLAWNNAAGVILFTPHSDPHFNFISQDITLDEAGGYKILCEWSAPQCAVTSLAPDLSVGAWQEYYLRRAFTDVCERILTRFEILTGRALVDSLVRLAAVFASRQNLDISITARKLVDREVFQSPQEAARNYRLLLGEIFDHFSAVIGPRLYASTLREIIKDLPEQERQILKSFDVFPKGYFYE